MQISSAGGKLIKELKNIKRLLFLFVLQLKLKLLFFLFSIKPSGDL